MANSCPRKENTLASILCSFCRYFGEVIFSISFHYSYTYFVLQHSFSFWRPSLFFFLDSPSFLLLVLFFLLPSSLPFPFNFFCLVASSLPFFNFACSIIFRFPVEKVREGSFHIFAFHIATFSCGRISAGETEEDDAEVAFGQGAEVEFGCSWIP